MVLAAAGIERLGFDRDRDIDITYFSPKEFIPAPCQGIIAVESRKDSAFIPILEKINHKDTYLSFLNERAFMQETGTGCQFPMGAYSVVSNEGMEFICFYKDKKCSLDFKADKNEAVGKMAALKIKERL